MGKNIYVGNLSYSLSSNELEELFAQFGPVDSAKIIEDRESGRSKGFGFVEMQEEADAAAAIEELNGKEFGGRNMVVNEAKPRSLARAASEAAIVAVPATKPGLCQ